MQQYLTGNQSINNQHHVFKYPYQEHLSRHKRSTDDFFDDNNNIAMYIVVPILVLCYGGCASIYCCHKCRQYMKENDPVQDLKTGLIKFKHIITGKKENSRSENFRKELEERHRPSSVKSIQPSYNEKENIQGVRSTVSTPGLYYFQVNERQDIFDLQITNSENSTPSARTESTFISTIRSTEEEHPFAIKEPSPETHTVSVHQSYDSIFMAPSAGTATFVKKVSLTRGDVKYSNLETNSTNNNESAQYTYPEGVWSIDSYIRQTGSNCIHPSATNSERPNMQNGSMNFEQSDVNALSGTYNMYRRETSNDTLKTNKKETNTPRQFTTVGDNVPKRQNVANSPLPGFDPPAYSEIGHTSFSSNNLHYSKENEMRTPKLFSSIEKSEKSTKYELDKYNPTIVNLQTSHTSEMSYNDINSVSSPTTNSHFSSSNTDSHSFSNPSSVVDSNRRGFSSNHVDVMNNVSNEIKHSNQNVSTKSSYKDIRSYGSFNSNRGHDNYAFNGDISLGKIQNNDNKKSKRFGKRPRDPRIVDYWR